MQPGRINETCSVPIIKDCNGVTMTTMMMVVVVVGDDNDDDDDGGVRR